MSNDRTAWTPGKMLSSMKETRAPERFWTPSEIEWISRAWRKWRYGDHGIDRSEILEMRRLWEKGLRLHYELLWKYRIALKKRSSR